MTQADAQRHVLIIGGTRIAHRYLRDIEGVNTSLMIEAGRVKTRDGEDNKRVIGVASEDAAEWLGLARAVHASDPISAVAAYHERGQDKAAKIASELGLRFHNADTVEAVRNKLLMRERLRHTKVDNTPSALAADAGQITEIASRFGYPVVVKPVDSWASTGVSILKFPEEAAVAFARAQASGSVREVLVEPFLEGKEVSVEAFSQNGDHEVVCVTDKFKDPVTLVERGHVVPSDLPEADIRQISGYVDGLLSALGFRDGVSHTEVILTGNGPRVVETHTRAAGDYIPEAVADALNVDLFEFQARQTVGERVLEDLRSKLEQAGARKVAAVWFGTPATVGEIEHVSGVEDSKQVKGVTDVQLLKKVGDTLGPVNNSFDRAVYVRTVGETRESALSSATEALREIEFRVRTKAEGP